MNQPVTFQVNGTFTSPPQTPGLANGRYYSRGFDSYERDEGGTNG
jgi:hypothetical protein